MINRSLKFLTYILLSTNCILGQSGLMIMSPEPASEVSGEDVLIAVCLWRGKLGHFTKDHHFGFEAAAWYWHFVDVVWLFLFAAIYIWGS